MSFDDFFKNFDEKKKEVESSEAVAIDEKIQRKDFLYGVVARMTPIAEKYRDELIKRDLAVEIKSSKGGITFSMEKRNTNYTHVLTMSEGEKFDGYFTFVTHSTNDDGRKFQSTDGASYSQSNWNDDIFVGKLQKHVDDYLFYSQRH